MPFFLSVLLLGIVLNALRDVKYDQRKYYAILVLKSVLLLMLSFCYALFRIVSAGESTVLSMIAFSSIYERILTFPKAIWMYLKIIFFSCRTSYGVSFCRETDIGIYNSISVYSCNMRIWSI